MRLFSAWSLAALAALSRLCVADGEVESPGDSIEGVDVDAAAAFTALEVSVTASFPQDNPFGPEIVNGETNSIDLLVENNSDRNITILSVGGSFHDAQTDTLIKNTTEFRYGLRVYNGGRVQIPYKFHSEFKTGDIRLRLWLRHIVHDQIFQVPAYDSIVVVVEPEVSAFDYQVISTYLLTAVFLGGLGYLAYITFIPKPKKSRHAVPPAASAPTMSATAVSSGGYEEEWIPVHHLKTNAAKTRSRKKTGAASSGDEQSGGDTSGADSKRRRGVRK